MSKFKTITAFILLIAFYYVNVCGASDEIDKPGIFDVEVININKSLSSYNILVTTDFVAEGVELVNMDDAEVQFIDDSLDYILQTMNKNIYNELADIKEINKIQREGNIPSNSIVLEGRIVRLNAGTATAKTMNLLFGNGLIRYVIAQSVTPEDSKVGLTIEGRLYESDSGQTIANFRHTKSFGGTRVNRLVQTLADDAEKTGYYVAKFLRSLYKTSKKVYGEQGVRSVQNLQSKDSLCVAPCTLATK